MFRILFLLFVIIPIIEIAVLMQVGSLIGAWPTVGIVIITAWLGAKNVRQQGITTMQTLQAKMAQGEAPSDEIVAGLLLLIAGVLLITPGFVTDAFGLLLLVPQFRIALIKSVQSQLINKQSSNVHFRFHQQNNFEQHFNQQKTPENKSTSHHGNTIEGEFERKE